VSGLIVSRPSTWSCSYSCEVDRTGGQIEHAAVEVSVPDLFLRQALDQARRRSGLQRSDRLRGELVERVERNATGDDVGRRTSRGWRTANDRATVVERRTCCLVQDVQIDQAGGGLRLGGVAVIQAHVPLPGLVADREVTLEAGVDLPGGETEELLAQTQRGEAHAETAAAGAVEILAERVVSVLARDREAAEGRQGIRCQGRIGRSLVDVKVHVRADVIGQVVGTHQERVGALLRRHDQVDRGVVVFVVVRTTALEAMIVGGASAGCTRIARQEAAIGDATESRYESRIGSARQLDMPEWRRARTADGRRDRVRTSRTESVRAGVR